MWTRAVHGHAAADSQEAVRIWNVGIKHSLSSLKLDTNWGKLTSRADNALLIYGPGKVGTKHGSEKSDLQE